MGAKIGKTRRKIPGKASTIKPCLAKETVPLLDDFLTAGLDDLHDIPQGAFRDAGVVVTEITLARSGDPNLCGVGVGRALTDVDMNGLQRVTYVGPEKTNRSRF